MAKILGRRTYSHSLEYVGKVSLPRFYGRFSPSTMFQVGSAIGGMKIARISEEFMTLFLPIPFGKPTKNPPDVLPLTWPYWKLNEPMYDADIFHNLSEENRVARLVRIYQVMSMGDKGPSVMDGAANVAFILPVPTCKSHTLARTAYWSVVSGQWCLDAVMEPVDDLREIRRKYRLPQKIRVFGGLPENDAEGEVFTS